MIERTSILQSTPADPNEYLPALPQPIIVHRGRKFYVHDLTGAVRESGEPEVNETASKWLLKPVSGRGSDYRLFHNKPNPKMLFGVARNAVTGKVLEGWFRQGRDGTLRSLG